MGGSLACASVNLWVPADGQLQQARAGPGFASGCVPGPGANTHLDLQDRGMNEDVSDFRVTHARG